MLSNTYARPESAVLRACVQNSPSVEEWEEERTKKGQEGGRGAGGVKDFHLDAFLSILIADALSALIADALSVLIADALSVFIADAVCVFLDGYIIYE